MRTYATLNMYKATCEPLIYTPPDYSFDPVVISFRRIWRVETSASSDGFAPAAVSYNCRPAASDMAITREDTVTPSRRFFLNIVHG